MDQQSYGEKQRTLEEKSTLEGSQVAARLMAQKYLGFIPPGSPSASDAVPRGR